MFEMEVPEIEDGIIEILAIARHPGERSKIIVKSQDRRIDPVGACVGMRGSRIQAIVRELSNEKIDIINNSEQSEILISRALSPAKPIDLYIDDDRKYCVALFNDDELEFAIGRGGVNINLASRVTDFRIDAFGKKQYERQKEDQATLLKIVPEFPDDLVAPLADNNIKVVSDLLNADEEGLLKIEAINDENLEKCYLVIQNYIERIEEEETEEEEDIEIKEILKKVDDASKSEVIEEAEKQKNEKESESTEDDVEETDDTKDDNKSETETNVDNDEKIEDEIENIKETEEVEEAG
jgi:N utilization substance protein A